MAMAHDALAAILGLEISMLGEKIRDLGLDRLRQQRASSLPQDFGELVVKGSWLNQLEHVIVGHGISLLQWRSGVVKQPHDMPPFRFLPSPTFSDSSGGRSQILCSVDQVGVRQRERRVGCCLARPRERKSTRCNKTLSL